MFIKITGTALKTNNRNKYKYPLQIKYNIKIKPLKISLNIIQNHFLLLRPRTADFHVVLMYGLRFHKMFF